jgi:hypothetical protein
MATLRSIQDRNIDINLAYRQEGDWGKANMLLSELPSQILNLVLVGQRRFARLYKKAITTKIDNHGGGTWAPSNSAAYKRFKESKGKSITDLLSFYGDYRRNIKITEGNKGVSVGVNKNARNSNLKTGLTIAQYANVLEHGSFWQDIPARPLWSSTFAELGGKRRVLREVTKGISEAMLRRYGINISTTIK